MISHSCLMVVWLGQVRTVSCVKYIVLPKHGEIAGGQPSWCGKVRGDEDKLLKIIC